MSREKGDGRAGQEHGRRQGGGSRPQGEQRAWAQDFIPRQDWVGPGERHSLRGACSAKGMENWRQKLFCRQKSGVSGAK